ncbi:MAG: hypothetical protein KJ831_02275 [Candidatus Eisenbacteria bacterium]|nr:hypothetical protein [Candidatus Eisenbacteria bacterium]
MKQNELSSTIEIRDEVGQVVGTKEVVMYSSLLLKAHAEGLTQIETKLLQVPSDENGRTAIVQALVETSKGKFQALGDASPDNVEAIIIPHLIRAAETRAKSRALRDAVNIGIVSHEELDGDGFAPNGPDPGSGAQPDSPQEVPQNISATGSDSDSSITEPQQRYLFRLLKEQGLKGKAAEDHLMQALGVPLLSQATKRAAGELIDQLLKEANSASAEAR